MTVTNDSILKPDQAAFVELTGLVCDVLKKTPDATLTTALQTSYSDRSEHLRRRFPAANGPVFVAMHNDVDAARRDELAAVIFGATKLVGSSEQPISTSVETDQGRFTFVYLTRAIACAIAASTIFPPHPLHIVQQYKRCKRAWESDRTEYLAIAPLSHATMDGFSTVTLSHGFAVDRLRSHHESFVWPGGKRSEEEQGFAYEPIVLIKSFSAPKPGLSQEQARRQAGEIVQAVTALRLCGGEPVGCGRVVVLPCQIGVSPECNWVFYLGGTTPYKWRKSSSMLIDDGVDSRFEEIIKVWQGGGLDSIELALERFNWSSSRELLEDQIIDMAIALENTLLRDVDTELKYRLALRGAVLLRHSCNPRETKELLNALYDVRSAVVHGGKRLDQIEAKKRMNTESELFVKLCYSVTKRILNGFIDAARNGESPSECCVRLDATVFDELRVVDGPTLAGDEPTTE